jgi:hypothetical protein
MGGVIMGIVIMGIVPLDTPSAGESGGNVTMIAASSVGRRRGGNIRLDGAVTLTAQLHRG